MTSSLITVFFFFSVPSHLISLLISFLLSWDLSLSFHLSHNHPLSFSSRSFLFLCFLACSLVWQESAVNRGERRRESPGSIMGTSMVHMVHKHINAATLQKGKQKMYLCASSAKQSLSWQIQVWGAHSTESWSIRYLDQHIHSAYCTV